MRLPGPVFLSHASENKPFVFKLEAVIKQAGFETWLDAHELLPGDDLPGKISEALVRAGAVVVVVSEAALKSRWLPYELRLATQRMIDGELRLIPVRLEEVEMPAEVRSMLYADFTEGFDDAAALVLRALEQEAKKFRDTREKQYLYLEADRLVMEVFDGTAYVSHDREYRSLDYNVALLEQSDRPDVEIPYDTEDAYSEDARPLTSDWLNEFLEADISQMERYSFVITRRRVDLELDSLEGSGGRVRVRHEVVVGLIDRVFYLVDVSGGIAPDEHRRLLALVRSDIERRENERSDRP